MKRYKIFCALILIILNSCKDEMIISLPKPVTLQQKVNFHGLPFSEFNFKQNLNEIEGESKTTLSITNLLNVNITNLKYIIYVYKNLDKSAENLAYVYTDSLQTILYLGSTTESFIINNTSDLVLKEGLVEIGILSLTNNYKYSGLYQGTYKTYSDTIANSKTLISTNLLNGYISADGLLDLKLFGSLNTKIVKGFFDENDNLNCEAIKNDGTVLFKLTNHTPPTLINKTLGIELRTSELNNPDNYKMIHFTLNKI